MPDGSLFSIIGIVICLAFSAFFSASETAYTSFSRSRMKTLAAEGNKKAALAMRLADSYDKLLSTILVGNNIVNISASSIATVLFVRVLTDTSIAASAPAISTAVITVVVLIFGEISPKSLAKEHAEGVAMAVARPLYVLCIILTPVNALFMLWKKLLSKVFKGKAEDTVTEGEVLTLVDEAHEDGSIDEYNKELIENIFEFDDLTAGEIATHRTDLVMLSVEDSMEEWEAVINNSRFSRYPVYGERVDDIVGILDARAYFRLEDKSRETVFAQAVSPAYFVPENVKLDVLFRNMKSKREFVSVVLDEHGGTTGIVTMTDLIECLLGEFSTEPSGEEVAEPEFEQIGDAVWLVRGDALISDVNKKLGTAIDEDEADTLSGYILGLNGTIPEDGTTFELETEALHIRALRIQDHTVERAELTIKPPHDEQDGEGTDDNEAEQEKKDEQHREPGSEAAGDGQEAD